MAIEKQVRDVRVERYYPNVLASAKEFKALADAENPEFRLLWERVWKWHANTFVYDFDEQGAARWEAMLGIRPKRTDTLEDRRNAILVKINTMLPYTYRRMEQILDALCGAGRYEVELDHAAGTLGIVANPDLTRNINQITGVLRPIVPANLALYIVMRILQEWEIEHIARMIGIVDACHNIWNLGEAKITRWDNVYEFDRTIRFDGIFGANYCDRQQHRVAIWNNIEAWQHNLVLVNIFDGSFNFDSTHIWRGSTLTRSPVSRSNSNGACRARHFQATKQNGYIWTICDAYLPNFIRLQSNDAQYCVSPQIFKMRQIGDEKTCQNSSSHIIWRIAAENCGVQTAKKDMCPQQAGTAENKTAMAYSNDYRDSNRMNGSFCFDGSHAFAGAQKRNIAKITHLCTAQKINQTNTIERIDRI